MKSSPITAIQDEPGTVEITHHASENMEEALVDHLSKTYNGGKACVLTCTNYEALQVQGILTQKGIRSKLIQSNDGFNLYDLDEVRFFLGCIDRQLNSPVIDDTLWADAKKSLKDNYAASSCLPNCLNMLSEFEAANSSKFRTDLDEFFKESKYEDFYSDENETIYVSTIHKSKGREFDSVYLLLKNAFAQTDEEKRKLYVAMTRAKDSLYIHCNSDIFNNYSFDGLVRTEDTAEYSEPSELSLQLTFRDVFLGFFKDKKDIISKLRSGDELTVSGSYLVATINGRPVHVAKFSKAFSGQIESLRDKGYLPVNTRINYVLAWKGKEDKDKGKDEDEGAVIDEAKVILPVLRVRVLKNDELHS